MKSKWSHLKDEAVALRKVGTSMTVIERKLGIPRSTLSLWFKDIKLTEEQRTKLMRNSKDGWERARARALQSHQEQKALRLLKAKQDAQAVLNEISLTNATLDLAFAMLYLGEGSKNGTTSIASSDPNILKFVLIVLERNYGITRDMVKCELHLRADQDPDKLKLFWSKELGVPLSGFRKSYIDQRSAGRPTYNRYKGVCVLYCGSVAIQRKLMYLYKLFYERIAEINGGG